MRMSKGNHLHFFERSPERGPARSFRGRRPPCTHNLGLTGTCGAQTPAAASAPPSPQIPQFLRIPLATSATMSMAVSTSFWLIVILCGLPSSVGPPAATTRSRAPQPVCSAIHAPTAQRVGWLCALHGQASAGGEAAALLKDCWFMAWK